MRRLSAIAAAAMAFGLPGSVTAQQPTIVSGTESYWLAERCGKARSTAAADFCSGYILASLDRLSLEGVICPTAEGLNVRALAVVKKYIADHPERWDGHPAALVEEALVFGFPCRSGQGSGPNR